VGAAMTLTDQQIVSVFEAAFGFEPRAADLAMLRIMSPSGVTSEDLAHYIWDHWLDIWDHWLGEPDEPPPEQVEECICAHCGEEG
jgi:hypothetical protein